MIEHLTGHLSHRLSRLGAPKRNFLLFLALLATLGLAPSVRAQTLSIDPSVSLPGDTHFNVQVTTQCLGLPVMGVDAEISFNPVLVQLDSIAAGRWFTGEPGEFFFWDYTSPGTGLIHFTGSLLGGSSAADDTLATCFFTALASGESPLVFQTVDVRDAENADLGFSHSTGDLILIDSAISTRERTFSALKAIYR